MIFFRKDRRMTNEDPKIKEAADNLRNEWGVGEKAARLRGKITGIHPPKQVDGRVKGGFIWVKGEDDVAYFGHITQIEAGVDIYDLRINQDCTFVPDRTDKGPSATAIEF